MSKAVLMSIKPKWVELILDGKKTVEVRKTAPKLETPFKVYMYCIKSDKKYKDIWTTAYMTPSGNLKNMSGMVVAEFTSTKIHKVDNNGSQFSINNDIALTNRIGARSRLDFDDMKRYLGTKDGYAWEIENLKVYDIPKSLWEFIKPCPEMSDLDNEEICEYCYETDYGKHAQVHTPNGVYFCEGRWCEKAYEAYKEENYAITRPPQSWQYVEEI